MQAKPLSDPNRGTGRTTDAIKRLLGVATAWPNKRMAYVSVNQQAAIAAMNLAAEMPECKGARIFLTTMEIALSNGTTVKFISATNMMDKGRTLDWVVFDHYQGERC